MPNGTREAVTITAEATTAGVKTNTVNVTADGDVLTADNTDSTTTPIYQPTCGAFFANNTAWPCPAGSVPNNAAVNSTIVDDATCCTRIPVPNIRLTKTGPSTPQAVGSPFQFTLTVASNGQDAAPNVTVVDNLGAANMQPLAVTPEPGESSACTFRQWLPCIDAAHCCLRLTSTTAAAAAVCLHGRQLAASRATS